MLRPNPCLVIPHSLQEKQPAPTSYASAARMAPSAPKDDARPPRGASGAAAGAASVVPAAAAPVQHRETVDDIPNGVIVKKIPEGLLPIFFARFVSSGYCCTLKDFAFR